MAWILRGPPVYPADLLSRRFRGEESVIRLSLGKLLVNLLQVVKRTNTSPLIIPKQYTDFYLRVSSI